MLSKPYILLDAPISGFVHPDDVQRTNLLIDYAMGGYELNNPIGGLQLAVWEASLRDHDICFRRLPTTTYEPVIITSGTVTEVTCSFDTNMRPHVAWVEDDKTYFHWYNTKLSTSETIELPETQSPRLFLDDKRATANSTRDLMLFYLWERKLYFKAQRERFEKVNFIIDMPAAALYLGRIGMGKGNRLQIEFILDPCVEEE